MISKDMLTKKQKFERTKEDIGKANKEIEKAIYSNKVQNNMQ